MTDVWKSNKKKFCTMCKVWYADNKASIQHHETGMRHKAAIQIKLRDLGKQSTQRQLESHQLQSTLAAMNSAALGSYRKDRSVNLASSSITSTGIGPNIPGDEKTVSTYMTAPKHGTSIVDMAKEMAEKKREREEKKRAMITRSEFWNDDDGGIDPGQLQGEKVWVEARSDEGDLYYWHIYSGETEWEMPSDGFYTAEEYDAIVDAQPEYFEQRRPSMRMEGDGDVISDMSGTGETVPAPALRVAERKPDAWNDERMGKREKMESAKRKAMTDDEEAIQPENNPSSETSRSESLAGRYMPGVVGRYYTAPAPMPLPMPRFDPAAYAATYSVPITQETVAMDDSMSETPKEEPEERRKELPIDRRRNDPDRLKEMLRKQRGELSSNGREETPEEKLNRLIAADHAQPFGAWTRVVVPDIVPDEQPSKVDQEVVDSKPPTETLRPELVVTFKEKMVESIGKSKSKKSSAPVEFKKRKTTIKATLRSRDSDED